MADIDMDRNPDFAVFDFSPDEVIDIRKHALECAGRFLAARNSYQPGDIDFMLKITERFEEHLMRGVPKNG
jgi:hypothetical protein